MSLVGKLNQSFSSDRLIPYALQCSSTIFLADHQLKIFLRTSRTATSFHSCIFIIVTKGNFCQVRIVSGRHPTNPTPPDFTCFSASARIFRISWGWSFLSSTLPAALAHTLTPFSTITARAAAGNFVGRTLVPRRGFRLSLPARPPGAHFARICIIPV
jgi:hypothetical protein